MIPSPEEVWDALTQTTPIGRNLGVAIIRSAMRGQTEAAAKRAWVWVQKHGGTIQQADDLEAYILYGA